MSLLNDGGLQKLFGTVLGSAGLFGEDATLTTIADGSDADGAPNGVAANHVVRVTPLEVSAYRRASGQVPDGESEVLVYQYAAPVVPLASHRLTVRGVVHEITRVTADPAGATWTCGVRPL